MATRSYNRTALLLGQGGLDLDSVDLRVALVTSAYVHDPDHDFASAFAGAELSGGNYSRKILSGVTWSIDDVGNRAFLDASDAVFPLLSGAAGTPSAAIVFAQVNDDSDSVLVACVDGGATPFPAPQGGDYVVQWAATGIVGVAA